MEEEIISEEKLLKLLLLIKLARKIEGKTRLQKMVFLGKEEEDLDMGFEFITYNYGPYSFELTKALDTLQNLGLIVVESSFFASSNSNNQAIKQFTYYITDKGDKLIVSKGEKLPKELIEKIKLLVEKWNKVPRTKIIEYVYSNYMK